MLNFLEMGYRKDFKNVGLGMLLSIWKRVEKQKSHPMGWLSKA
jgi:hypothetical protein